MEDNLQDINQSIYNTHSPRATVLTRSLKQQRTTRPSIKRGKASALNRANGTPHSGLIAPAAAGRTLLTKRPPNIQAGCEPEHALAAWSAPS